MNGDLDKALALVGVHVQSQTKDYGTVTEIITICDISGEQRYIAVMDNGKKLDAASIQRLLRSNRIRNNKTEIVYPDGSSFAKYFSGPKKIHRGNGIAYANLDQKVTVDGVTIDITSTSSSGNNFEEENKPGFDETVTEVKKENTNA